MGIYTFYQTRTPVYLSHTPAGTSSLNIMHWLQMVKKGTVAMYDYGTKENKKKYGQANPPEYDFTKIENPIYVYSGDSDWLADPDDVSGYLMPRISHTVVMFGLRLNAKKTEYLTTDLNESGSNRINGTELARTSIFRYLGSAIAMCGAECWPATKETESRLSVMETKMLHWVAGVTHLDRIRNEAVRQKFSVAPIADKMREVRLRCYAGLIESRTWKS
ncbi:unnamed protein product [Heligmosomoides polygyrus]|uniref:RNA-dependent RNA polymerase n=1 Tax=Heligmosomoides polygyrus TaxID=6339 RepID=A0A183FQI3_HELPZ|nr:unnamed protein product [Heligmosomoides polygyrus]